MGDILDDLKDLHKQATTERSHNYVASCCVRAAAEITNLRAERNSLRIQLIASKPMYSRRKLEAERDALALTISILTNERDEARARGSQA